MSTVYNSQKFGRNNSTIHQYGTGQINCVISKQGNIIQALKRKENFMDNDMKNCPRYIFKLMK